MYEMLLQRQWMSVMAQPWAWPVLLARQPCYPQSAQRSSTAMKALTAHTGTPDIFTPPNCAAAVPSSQLVAPRATSSIIGSPGGEEKRRKEECLHTNNVRSWFNDGNCSSCESPRDKASICCHGSGKVVIKQCRFRRYNMLSSRGTRQHSA